MAKKLNSKGSAPAKKIKANLYSSPRLNPTRYQRTEYVIRDDPNQLILPSERRDQIIQGRDLFAKVPLVCAAIKNKNHVAIGNAWQPVFAGDVRKDTNGNDLQADVDWINSATKYLINDFYPNVNWNGQNFSFQDTLFLTGKDIDVDGGSLMIFRTTKNGLPRIELLPVDRIGSRDGSKLVKGGSYDGYKIYDGIIYSDQNMPVALNILGSTVDADVQISLFNCQYLFEPEWQTAPHGVSRIANSVTHLRDIADINEFLRMTVKNFSLQGIIHKNAKAAAPKGTKIYAKEDRATAQSSGDLQNKVFMDVVNKGGTQFISSLDGSDISPFTFDRPSPNTEAFIYRIASEAIASLGWHIELICPQRLNGTSTRLIQDSARKLISWRQQTLTRRAKAIVQYGLAVAMQLGLVPKTTNPSWLKWSFQHPPELTVDTGSDAAAEQEALRLGLTTKAAICAKRGKDWQEVSKQTDLELRDIFTRAQTLAKDFNITEAEAREWISKRDIDVIAPSQPKENATASTEEPFNPADN